jgi:hypothetical protein
LHSTATHPISSADDTNGVTDVFVRDRLTGMTQRMSVDSSGHQANNESQYPSISTDGRYVVFGSYASNLVPGDNNGIYDAFVHDCQLGVTERVSVDSSGGEGNNRHGSSWPSISDDGRYVAFVSDASNLVPADTNGTADVFVRDRQLGTTERVSVDSGGAQGNDSSSAPSMFAGTRYILFTSAASNLVPLDRNSGTDAFLRDRQPVAPAFTSRCEPGSGGVISCPCSNPPAGTERGCDNSAGSGGASLVASGNTQLSADGLAFTTSDENAFGARRPVETFLPAGVVYGQGVRCRRRLYVSARRAQGAAPSRLPTAPPAMYPCRCDPLKRGTPSMRDRPAGTPSSTGIPQSSVAAPRRARSTPRRSVRSPGRSRTPEFG